MNKKNNNIPAGSPARISFEGYIEETKRTGLELILTLQTFTMNPDKKTLESAFDLIVDYKILNDTTAYLAEAHQLTYLEELNNCLSSLMSTLDLREVYRNITEKNMDSISKKFSKKMGRNSIFSNKGLLPEFTTAG